MSWNYRVIRREKDGEVTYAIHECFYNNKGETVPTRWTSAPIDVSAETRGGLFWAVGAMTEGMAKPVLEVSNGKLIEVEPMRELTDDLKKAIALQTRNLPRGWREGDRTVTRRATDGRLNMQTATDLDITALKQCLAEAAAAMSRMVHAASEQERFLAASNVQKHARRASVVAQAIQDRFTQRSLSNA